MQSRAKLVFIGMNSFQGKKPETKDKTFYSARFLQGTEMYQSFLEEGQNLFFENVDIYDTFDLEVNTFIRSDRGIPTMALRILAFYSVTSVITGEITDYLKPSVPQPDITPEIKTEKPDNEKKFKAV